MDTIAPVSIVSPLINRNCLSVIFIVRFKLICDFNVP
jgi:hypothetical protein